MNRYFKAMTQALGITSAATLDGTDALSSVYPVSAFAGAAIGTAGAAIAELIGEQAAVQVDQRLACLWFGWSLRPQGWTLPPAWDPIAGDYQTADGWIRLHTNAANHRNAALRVLGVEADKERVMQAVAHWRADELEAAVVAQGGCAATMRSEQAWADHVQGQSVAKEALFDMQAVGQGAASNWQPSAGRPLAGVRVLDLTRILAGPVATRFLAGFGADVLRIDPPDWDEPVVAPEVTLGKRCARLDLRTSDGRAVLVALLREADVIVHGYRGGALDALGLDAAERQRIRPGLIDVCLNAYGWSGPWRQRRGFDSLVQMSAGIAEAGMRLTAAARPTPLPVQALDHATGYLMAAAVVRGLTERRRTGLGLQARTSLARVAALLCGAAPRAHNAGMAPAGDGDYAQAVELTSWGPAQRLLVPLQIEGAPMRWDLPAGALGSAAPAWA